MIRNSINLVAGIGILGFIIGLVGEPSFLLGSCILIGSALIAAAIASQRSQ